MASSYVLPNPAAAPHDAWPSYVQRHSRTLSATPHAHSHSLGHVHSHKPHVRSPLRNGDVDSRVRRASNYSASFAVNTLAHEHNYTYDSTRSRDSSPSHGHTHDHDHDHDHKHDHSHSHDHDDPSRKDNHDLIHDHNHNHSHDYTPPHAHSYSCPQHSLHSHGPAGSEKLSSSPSRSRKTYTHSAADSVYEKAYSPPANSTVFEQQEAGALSPVTNFMLQRTAEWPILHAIMKEADSRRIFYFMSLNFAFMLVQAFYGYVTDSLGLLSDSIHMFFDCVALAVGLFAAVASKWQPNERFPYGFGKIETLSGFANGIFLVLISVEIMVEAVERLLNGQETQRLWELFIVSTLGLLVNLVGMFSFGHHHHHGDGHDCPSHSHASNEHDHALDHSHDHSHSHSHDHGHDHGHDHSHSHDHGHDHKDAHGKHSHSHDNENMYGIYLHVLADTLGSAAVIVSTALTHLWGWSGWDPLASFLIAALILASAVPLVSSSARRLLLTMPASLEYSLQGTLADLASLPGVASYSSPRFWVDDRSGSQGRLLGVIHVVAGRGVEVGDVRDRVRSFLLDKGIDVVVQVEREGDGNCWCASGRAHRLSGVSMSGMPGHAVRPSIVF